MSATKLDLDKLRTLDTSSILNVIEVRTKQLENLRSTHQQPTPSKTTRIPFTTSDYEAANELLKTIPVNASGMLPYDEFQSTPQWKKLVQQHSKVGIMAFLRKIHEKRAKSASATKNTMNFCPNCGYKLQH